VNPESKWPGTAQAQQDVKTFENQIGTKLGIDSHFYYWGQKFPTSFESWDISNGLIPMESWAGTSLRSIANGSYDSMILARARALKALKSPVFLRWGYEMNGDWNSWSGASNGDNPKLFVRAWRHIHNLFAKVHASNVVWVWCPNDQSVPMQSWNAVKHYYPGNAYTDWIGIDGYNWGTTQSWSQWTEFSNLFTKVYRIYHTVKPIMIGETGSVDQGGSKADWITNMASAIQTDFPSIEAVVYMDTGRWAIDPTSSAMTAFRTMALESYFRP
jgi:beta-mannanase